MGVNRVTVQGQDVIDLRSDTVSPENLLEGVKAHNSLGNQIVGAMKAVASGSSKIYSGTITLFNESSAQLKMNDPSSIDDVPSGSLIVCDFKLNSNYTKDTITPKITYMDIAEEISGGSIIRGETVSYVQYVLSSYSSDTFLSNDINVPSNIRNKVILPQINKNVSKSSAFTTILSYSKKSNNDGTYSFIFIDIIYTYVLTSENFKTYTPHHLFTTYGAYQLYNTLTSLISSSTSLKKVAEYRLTNSTMYIALNAIAENETALITLRQINPTNHLVHYARDMFYTPNKLYNIGSSGTAQSNTAISLATASEIAPPTAGYIKFYGGNITTGFASGTYYLGPDVSYTNDGHLNIDCYDTDTSHDVVIAGYKITIWNLSDIDWTFNVKVDCYNGEAIIETRFNDNTSNRNIVYDRSGTYVETVKVTLEHSTSSYTSLYVYYTRRKAVTINSQRNVNFYLPGILAIDNTVVQNALKVVAKSYPIVVTTYKFGSF